MTALQKYQTLKPDLKKYEKQIRSKILEDIIPIKYLKAIEENNIKSAGITKIEILQNKEKLPLVINITIELLPNIQITNLENLFDSELSNHTLVNLLIKADTHGSLEAIIGSLKNFESEEVKINIVHDAVGGINVNDINLALTTGAMVVGFNVRADNKAKSLAESESIDISYHGIIYDLIDGIKDIIEGSLEPDIKEEILGTAQVKDTFKSPKFGLIAGSIVIDGTIKRNKFVRVIRDEIVIFEGVLDSLRRFKDDASEVPTGTECGIGIANYTDVKVGDKIEVFDKKEVRKSI